MLGVDFRELRPHSLLVREGVALVRPNTEVFSAIMMHLPNALVLPPPPGLIDERRNEVRHTVIEFTNLLVVAVIERLPLSLVGYGEVHWLAQVAQDTAQVAFAGKRVRPYGNGDGNCRWT